jgi:4-amino-4-deoxy-L-arabinose transferase-like glycosyltransferase
VPVLAETFSAFACAHPRVAAAAYRMRQVLAADRGTTIILVFILAVAALAPLGPLTTNRFHHDEALYSSWGLDIASGRDVMVSGSPVDKPPLFLYVQALMFLFFGATEAAARLPSLIASVLSVLLLYCLAGSLHGAVVGLLAAFLLAASPFAILFAPTAFTDPMMVAFVLAGCLAVVVGRWTTAGLLLGLAAMTKQQGVLFLPLVVGFGYATANHCAPDPSRSLTGGRWVNRSSLISFTLAVGLVLGVTITWDLSRGRQPGFLEQSLLSYSTLSLGLGAAWQRMSGFFALLEYGTGSPLLNGILAVGLPLLLATDIRALVAPPLCRDHLAEGDDHRRVLPQVEGREKLAARADLLMAGFVLLYLLGHSVVSFQVWDRYLLGLIPFLALLLARVLTLPWRVWCVLRLFWNWKKGSEGDGPAWLLHLLCGGAALVVLASTVGPLRDAATSRFPIGGDHGAFDGIEQVVNYFKGVPADTTLYHRWLGSHWRFYLWGSPYDFRAWTSAYDLAAQAAARPGASRYVVFPTWRSSTEARLALQKAGLVLREVHRAFRDDGSVSFVVYRIEEAQ